MTNDERNLMATINSRIRVGFRIRKTPRRAVQSLGQYHIINTQNNRVFDWGINDLEKYLSDMIEIRTMLRTLIDQPGNEEKLVSATNDTLASFSSYIVRKSQKNQIGDLGRYHLWNGDFSYVAREGLNTYGDLAAFFNLAYYVEEAYFANGQCENDTVSGFLALEDEPLDEFQPYSC